MEKLHTFADGTYLVYERGRIDNFLVSFYTENDQKAVSPTDIDFMNFLIGINNPKETWAILLDLAKQIRGPQTRLVDLNIKSVNQDINEEKMFSAIAAAMIAEENKARSILKKRIKLLGFHQILFQGLTPQQAANWSKGKGWREIDAECKRLGF